MVAPAVVGVHGGADMSCSCIYVPRIFYTDLGNGMMQRNSVPTSLMRQCDECREALLQASTPDSLSQCIHSKLELTVVMSLFNAVQDVSPDYLTQEDYQLAAKVYTLLGRRVPDSITRELS